MNLPSLETLDHLLREELLALTVHLMGKPVYHFISTAVP
jgi:hypothetical protein